jgi:hypothetical protein
MAPGWLFDPHRSRGRIVFFGLGVVAFTGIGILARSQDRQSLTTAAFAVAAAAAAGLVLVPVIRRLAARDGREATSRISLDVSPAIALEAASRALRALAPLEESIDVDRHKGTLVAELPRSWRSWGERLTLTIDTENGGSSVIVTSRSIALQLLDYGKNRANVSALVTLILDQVRSDGASG